MSNKAFDDMSLAEQKAYLLRRSEEIDRQTGPKKRREVPDVPQKVWLALGGKKVRRVFFDRRRQALRQATDIIFGPEGKTQLVFRPSRGRVKGAARWTVSLLPVPTSYHLQRELSKAGRGLWDKEKGEPSVAFKAAEQLLACDAQMRERYERAKQRATSSIEPKTTKDALYIYPKPY